MIDDNKKRENASIENSLMKKVKLKNEFEGEQKKRKTSKKITFNVLRKEWVNIMRKNPFKIHAKRKRGKYGEISSVIKKNNENVTRKKPKKAQTVESSKAKTTITHRRQRKKLHKQKLKENDSKLLLSEKFDFD